MVKELIINVKELSDECEVFNKLKIMTSVETYAHIFYIISELNQAKNEDKNKDYIAVIDGLNVIFNRQINHDINLLRSNQFYLVRDLYIPFLATLCDNYTLLIDSEDSYNFTIITTVH